ncbi:BTB/POZ domain-containing protein At1g50280 isoform X1 [Brachypodium distachyon]|uniref:NPH3 domain-containing protein n=1 Tax=Brachypodium distachyon TaxID=15368 RepID=A0A0Q3EFX6_BRADI|nr:BTB/POZ domain-containing protein At1g50280 isoform X1 [Brachypodium distachyon]KQJ85260.1 hypothetical protein BRADI_5g25950v3 [Brachypodium distachyon]|eukprot:XP_014750987.1 BTB/POZ domain-containing protein At1g50280 isoform X1 [Brachypodium distachyon]
MDEACDLEVHVNGHHTLLLHQSVVCGFSGKLRAMVATTKKKKPGKEAEPAAGALLSVELAGFPGGGEALELAARFCYGNGEPPPLLWRPTTFPLLYCAAVFLEMTEEVRPGNLLSQAEAFVHDDARRLWTWADAVAAVRSCERLVVSDSSTNAAAIADALLEKLVSALFSRIAAASRPANCSSSSSSSSPLSISSSSSSSPDTDSATKTPPPPELVTTTTKPCSSSGSGNEWWFDNVASLSPPTVEKATRFLGGEKNNKDPTITRFLLHYLRRRRRSVDSPTSDDLTLSVLANTAAHGVAALAATGGCFSSCRSLFRVLRTVSAAGASRESRNKLETLVGSLLDQATLDDLLVPVFVSGGGSVPGGGVYDVRLVVRLVRVFVMAMALEEEEEGTKRLRKVGRLVDKYLGEISPDQGLTVGRFLAVAESLPDSARGCFDGVYRALDIFLQSHAALTVEERAAACRCVNYEKLTLEACRDMARNRRVPAAVAVQALASQRWRPDKLRNVHPPSPTPTPIPVGDEEEAPRLSLWPIRRQSRGSGELETAAYFKEMTGDRRRTSKLQGRKSFGGRGLPWMC